MNQRITLTHEGTGEAHEIVVKTVEETKDLQGRSTYLLRGTDPSCYPESLRNEITFHSGSTAAAGQGFNSEHWPAANITSDDPITVDGWETSDDPIPEPDE